VTSNPRWRQRKETGDKSNKKYLSVGKLWNGWWRMAADGGWRMADGGWRMADDKM